ncbi:hypothetical protein HYPSUDRAFT_46055 [Hypholoma sublateritium FD-334 SS-4]|uniref:Heterokaryon incompatibility domain-containing protein n=1 Tax=Hypholoma sublateritium (strain FD-334 SS-4) TaxID=945553 RepID=A0A0D2PBS7_HYPSF|nr:hypothetical protein HYPSUDRAFT_46055 [Hypholoma sublateritium FD-334 SS-4]
MEVDKERHRATNKSPLMGVIQQTMREHIFNKMPIRLLAFGTDGSEIKLIERGEIWRKISREVARDFDSIEVDFRNQIKGGTKTPPVSEKEFAHQICEKYGKFAILSHTWLTTVSGEVTYTDWKSGKFSKESRGYRKLAEFCRITATQYDHKLAWIDTICINKESSSELDESIRSMYNWYQSASMCITYLADTSNPSEMHRDTWFTRGWTLQELIAPRHIKFHDANWQQIIPGMENDKKNPQIILQIKRATGIVKDELETVLSKTPISRRMQWAAHRRVTREEDMAYSLMGIFDVSISIAYGEGAERAFVRLLKEILNTSTHNVLDIVNWGHGDTPSERNQAIRTSALLPPGPQYYLRRATDNIQWKPPSTPISWTHLGLHVPVVLMPALDSAARISSARIFNPRGRYFASATGVKMFKSMNNRNSEHSFNVLDRSTFERHNLQSGRVAVFGVLNIVETETAIQIQDAGLCRAIPLKLVPLTGWDLPERFESASPEATQAAVTFKLQLHGSSSFIIPKSELHAHGMSFRIMYL